MPGHPNSALILIYTPVSRGPLQETQEHNTVIPAEFNPQQLDTVVERFTN